MLGERAVEDGRKDLFEQRQGGRRHLLGVGPLDRGIFGAEQVLLRNVASGQGLLHRLLDHVAALVRQRAQRRVLFGLPLDQQGQVVALGRRQLDELDVQHVGVAPTGLAPERAEARNVQDDVGLFLASVPGNPQRAPAFGNLQGRDLLAAVGELHAHPHVDGNAGVPAPVHPQKSPHGDGEAVGQRPQHARDLGAESWTLRAMVSISTTPAVNMRALRLRSLALLAAAFAPEVISSSWTT